MENKKTRGQRKKRKAAKFPILSGTNLGAKRGSPGIGGIHYTGRGTAKAAKRGRGKLSQNERDGQRWRVIFR